MLLFITVLILKEIEHFVIIYNWFTLFSLLCGRQFFIWLHLIWVSLVLSYLIGILVWLCHNFLPDDFFLNRIALHTCINEWKIYFGLLKLLLLWQLSCITECHHHVFRFCFFYLLLLRFFLFRRFLFLLFCFTFLNVNCWFCSRLMFSLLFILFYLFIVNFTLIFIFFHICDIKLLDCMSSEPPFMQTFRSATITIL